MRGKYIFCELSAFAFVSLVAAHSMKGILSVVLRSAQLNVVVVVDACPTERRQAAEAKHNTPHKVRAGSHIIVGSMS